MIQKIIKKILSFLFKAKPKRRYNRIPDRKDPRDYLFVMKAPPPPAVLPPKVDLTNLCSPVFDQGDIGSCTAQALAGLFEFAQLIELRAEKNPELYGPQHPVSKLFIYYGERVIEGTVNFDSGATLRSGIKVLAKKGVCREILWPYLASNLYLNPSPAAYVEAAQHKIHQYWRLQGLYDMKHCLASGHPFAFGMMVPASLESAKVAKTGIMPDPTPRTQFLGGHAVMCVGYDDVTRRMKIRNSWGDKWGDKGHFTISYDFIANSQYCMDFWTLVR